MHCILRVGESYAGHAYLHEPPILEVNGLKQECQLMHPYRGTDDMQLGILAQTCTQSDESMEQIYEHVTGITIHITCGVHDKICNIVHVVVHHSNLHDRQQRRGKVVKVVEGDLPLPSGCLPIIAVVVLCPVACEGDTLYALASKLYCNTINFLHST